MPHECLLPTPDYTSAGQRVWLMGPHCDTLKCVRGARNSSRWMHGVFSRSTEWEATYDMNETCCVNVIWNEPKEIFNWVSVFEALRSGPHAVWRRLMFGKSSCEGLCVNFFICDVFFTDSGPSKVIAVGLLTVGGGIGGTIVYAKWDNKFRAAVEKNVPYSDRLFGLALGPPPASGSLPVLKKVRIVTSRHLSVSFFWSDFARLQNQQQSDSERKMRRNWTCLIY